MTHHELVYWQLHTNGYRITLRDKDLGVYVYLCKNEDDANDLLAHLMAKFGKFATIEVNRLCDEEV